VHPVVIVCLALVLLGAVLAVRWGHLDFQPPPPAEDPTFAEQAKRAVWYLDLLTIGGIVSGILGAGAGGRLAMRLLAATAGDRAQGAITEADEVVGRITVDGTIGFMIFVGLFVGLLTATIYLVLRHWLPEGRVGALVLALVLLAALSTRLDPLRSNNPDFRLVGPDWLAVLVFLALGVFHALVLVAVMARLSRALPLLSRTPRVALAYAPMLLLGVLSLFTVATVAVLLAGALLSTKPNVRRVWTGPRTMVAGRVVIAVVVLAFLPTFVAAVSDILQGG
jgi:hypothetical protein